MKLQDSQSERAPVKALRFPREARMHFHIHGRMTSPELTTSNEENKQVSMPGSRRATVCRSMFPCRMTPYSHADLPFKFPHRNSGGSANV
jgi:hypothetical protein